MQRRRAGRKPSQARHPLDHPCLRRPSRAGLVKGPPVFALCQYQASQLDRILANGLSGECVGRPRPDSEQVPLHRGAYQFFGFAGWQNCTAEARPVEIRRSLG